MRATLATIAAVALLCVTAAGVAAEDAESAPAGEPATYFTGTFEESVAELPDPVMNPDTGVLEVRDGRLEFITSSDDPRVEGLYLIEPFAMDIDPTTGVGRMWGTGHIVRDEGTFEGPIWGLHYPVTEEVSGFTGSGWLTGTGDFEGLTYFYRGSFDGEQPFAEGIIFEGEAPPLQ